MKFRLKAAQLETLLNGGPEGNLGGGQISGEREAGDNCPEENFIGDKCLGG